MADKNYLDSDGVLYLWQKIKAKITDAVKNKVDKVNGKGLSTNDYTTAEKTKLAGIVDGANKYVHPTSSGNKHIPSGGSSGQILRWGADGTAVWEETRCISNVFIYPEYICYKIRNHKHVQVLRFCRICRQIADNRTTCWRCL